MPTLIAVRSGGGTARKIAVRTPVKTSSVMMMPSHTIRPIACDQVIVGAIE